MWIKTNKDELTKGIQIEQEHADTIRWLINQCVTLLKNDQPINDDLLNETIQRIAKDHLTEMSDYYTCLMRMEQGE